MMIRLSAWLAVAVAIPLAAVQVWRNYDNWDHWSTWTLDVLAAALLLIVGVLALRGAPRFLAPGWAFAVSLYLSSVMMRVESLHLIPESIYRTEFMLTQAAGALTIISLTGLALSLWPRRPG